MKLNFAGLLLPLLCASCATHSPTPQTVAGATPLEWSQRLADSEMARKGDSLVWKPGGKAKWDYSVGLFTLSLLKLAEATGDARYQKFSEDAIGSFIEPDGTIHTYNRDEYQLDSLNSGKTLLALWQITKEQRFAAPATLLRQQLNTQPRTPDGGFWHKQRYPDQMWLDGLYMAAPFYAQYAATKLFRAAPGDFDDVVKQFRLIDEHTYDAGTGLNYHGWDAAKIQPWANPATGCSSNFWGRAEGWYAMALVDVLDYLPANHPARQQIIATLQKTARGILKWQDPQTGLWWQVMNQGDRPGNYREATASAMFVYALAKGVNQGYLPRDYLPQIEKGYAGIIENFIQPEGDNRWSLTHCCSVAGLGGSAGNGQMRDGSFSYYAGEPVVNNDLKGVGPFILTGIELQKAALNSR
jgi:unsaturated rhamnogalacturonyl hydrolase